MKTILDLGREKNKTPQTLPEFRWLSNADYTKKRIHVAGLGDVGGMVTTALCLVGRKVIRTIGIYDLDPNRCKRWEFECGQIREVGAEQPTPEVCILKENELFDCDVFLFCVARAVPAVGSGVSDVRMAQYELNAPIAASYARKAADCGYMGLFVVVSDPVDLLCQAALKGGLEGSHPLHPYQIQGCGLGVMNARASFYASRIPEFSLYLSEGRAFGPHGKDLVVANSIIPEHYNESVSLELTRRTIGANMEVRAAGYKPYVAPAISSAAYTICRIISGQWNDSAQYLNGVYFGARNRTTRNGIQFEEMPLNPMLYTRLERTYRELEKYEVDHH